MDIRSAFIGLARMLETKAARVQGKGFGSYSIGKENEAVHRLLGRSPGLAVDIGGNVGNYTAELRRRTPALEIHIFEPSAANVAKLRARFAGDAKIAIVPAALSDENGSATLFSDVPGSGLASLAKRRLEHHGLSLDLEESVSTMRFEEYWQSELAGREIDIVKMDVEGYELQVLQGFGAAIGRTRIVQFEFGGCNIDTRSFFRDFWYFFTERGFRLYRITPFGPDEVKAYRERDEFFSTTNYIAVKS